MIFRRLWIHLGQDVEVFAKIGDILAFAVMGHVQGTVRNFHGFQIQVFNKALEGRDLLTNCVDLKEVPHITTNASFLVQLNFILETTIEKAGGPTKLDQIREGCRILKKGLGFHQGKAFVHNHREPCYPWFGGAWW